MKLEQAVRQFIDAAEADGLRPKTVAWYRTMLQPLVKMYGGHEVTTITPVNLRQCITELRNRDVRYESGAASRPAAPGGLRQDTIAAHVRGFHRFWNWATAEYSLPGNPMANIKRPPMIEPKPKGITPEDFEALFLATWKGEARRGKRNRAILAFLYDTGCRAGGLLSLERDRLDLLNRRAIVREKGNKERTVFFGHETADLLREWLAVHPGTTSAVFCSIHHRGSGQPMSDTSLNTMLERLKAAAGVKGRVNPHSFRHAFAREFVKNGGDLSMLQKIMGHSDVSVTARYYAVFSVDELADSHDQFTPGQVLARLRPKLQR